MKAPFGEKWQDVLSFVETAMPNELMVACVDLDSVLLYHDPEDGISRLGPALPPGRLLVNLLKLHKYQVWVLTSRPAEQHVGILKHLQWLGFDVDCVTNIKPPADAYFDDKAFRIAKNWE